MTTISEQIDAALAEARKWNETAAKLIEKRKSECKHFAHDLTFMYSGVSTHRGGAVEHGLSIRCKCGSKFSDKITIHED